MTTDKEKRIARKRLRQIVKEMMKYHKELDTLVDDAGIEPIELMEAEIYFYKIRDCIWAALSKTEDTSR